MKSAPLRMRAPGLSLLGPRRTFSTATALRLRGRLSAPRWAPAAAPPLRHGIGGPRREFFELPGMAASSKSFVERRVVDFQPEEVFDVVADVDRYREFVPFCEHSRVTKVVSENEFYATMGVGFKVFTESYTSEIRCRRPQGQQTGAIDIRALDSPTFQTLTSSWKFAPGPREGSCEITFEVDFSVHNPLAAAAVSNFFSTVAEQQIRAFAKRCETVYGSRRPGAPARDPSRSRSAARQEAPPPTAEAGARPPQRPRADSVELDEDAALTLRTMRSHLPIGALQGGEGRCEENIVTMEAFESACAQLAGSVDGFEILGGASAMHKLIRAAVYESAASLHNVRSAGTAEKQLERFSRAVYAMVAADAEQRALFIFDLIDVNRDRRLSARELQAALEAHVDAVGSVIPRLIEHKRAHTGIGVEGEAADVAVARSLEVVGKVMEEVKREVPLAVAQILEEVDVDNSGDLSLREWMKAWHNHPEVLDLMSIRGLGNMILWAEVTLAERSADGDGRA